MPTLPQRNYSAENGKSHPKDRCQTPLYLVPPLLPYLPKDWVLWESAAGEGLLVKALEVYGYNVVATELLTGTDYFLYEPDTYDAQVTNVPFSLTTRWFTRAYALNKPFAFIAPSAWQFTKGAKALFKCYGIEVLSPSDRADFKMPAKGWDSHSQFHSSWYCWRLGIGARYTDVEIVKPKPQHLHLLDHPARYLEVTRSEETQLAVF